ncbi:hypothetical protein [Dyadobacter luticola]|uniref:Porin family protein n=1 Tax=Dyadobacter luticola TaxID=1979387 RepID=A0A5R9KYA3_9BACT|nr:hypothetical protein [Dyadobacter luticola]TLV01060.1 hypothetical protein FEN17_16510 [Dyadobacter luticola]
MKKLFLMLLLGSFWPTDDVQAQLQKGSRYWGATIGFNGDHAKSEYTPRFSSNNNQFRVSPSLQAGWFFKDNTMFGLRAMSSLSWFKNVSENPGQDYKSGIRNGNVSLSPFIRNYKSLSPKWAIFLHSGVNLSYIWSGVTMDEFDGTDTGYGASIYANPGIVYWFTPRFALESDLNLLSVSLGYTHLNGNDFNFSAGVTSSITSYFGLRASWYLQSK